MPRRRQSAGAIRLPSEYYGGNSGRYTANAKAGLCGNAYGNTIARSHGTIFADGSQTGPNMHAHPDAIGVQTGGRRRRRSNKNRSNKNRSNRNRSNKNRSKANKKRSNKNRSRTNKNRTQTRRNRVQRSKRRSERKNKRN